MSIGLGISNSISGKISGFGGGYDPDAVAYFTAVEDASGTLTALEKDLVNDWFVTERAAGRLSKYKAVYPFKGKTSGAAAINMVNPSTYDLSFTNFVTADFAVSGTLKGDGSTKYARMDTKIADVLQSANDSQFAAYCNSGVGVNGSMLGAQDSLSGSGEIINIIQGGTDTIASVGATTQAAITNTPQEGDSYIGARYSSTDLRLYENGVQVNQNVTASSGTLPESEHVAFFARERQGPTYTFYSDAEHSGFWLGEGFVHDDISDLDENFKAMLVDKDAQAYIQEVFDQGGSLTLAQQHAVNNLVKSMKADGLWDGAVRLYPFIGGTIDAARVDLVTRNQAQNSNFLDSDVDPKIGLQGDGSTKGLNTDDTAANLLASINDVQFGIFYDGLTDEGVETYPMGSIATAGDDWVTLRKLTTDDVRLYLDTGSFPTIGTDLTGVQDVSLIGARYSSTSCYVITDGVEGTEDTSATTAILPSRPFGIFARNVNGALSLFTSAKFNGAFIAETWTLEETKKFEKLYKAFIQQVQDGETYETDAAAYFQTVEDAGGTLTTNVKSEFTSFVSREVEAGRWSKIKRLYPFLGATIDSAVIDAVTLNSATNTNFVDADVDATIGLQGDGSTKSLRLTETADNILPDSTDFQIGVFRIGAVEQSTSLSRLFGYLKTSNTANRLYLQKNQLQPQCFATDGVTAAGGVLSSNSSHIGASFSSTDLKVLLDGVVTSTSTTARSTSFGTESIDLFAFNVNGSPSGHSSINSGGYFIASGLTLSETQALESSYKTFINNITA